MSTLTDGTLTVELPDALMWSDEFAHQAVQQTVTRGLDGTLILQEGLKQAGRPVTLAAPGEGGWVTRADVDRLYALSAVAGQVMTLTLRGVPMSVTWRHSDTALDASPITPLEDVQPDDYWRVTLRLMTL
jgi:hypothetical protein